MKKIIRNIAMTAATVTMLFVATTVFAQEKKDSKNPKQEKISNETVKAQKIAFLTEQLSLTPEEAERFWPVYNQCENERLQIRNEVRKSMKALSAACEDQAKNEAEIKALVEEYYKNAAKEIELSKAHYEKYTTVLPLKKAAKVRVIEEKFTQHLFTSSKTEDLPLTPKGSRVHLFKIIKPAHANSE